MKSRDQRAAWVRVLDAALRELAIDPGQIPVGATLWRKYNGVWHRVEVVRHFRRGKAFCYDGARHKTLTSIARQITGDPNLSGSRFFGLRRRPRSS